MLDLQEKKTETLGKLDAIISVLEELHAYSNKEVSSANSVNVTENDAFAFLFDVLRSLNGSTQDVMDWLVKLLEYIVPLMEVSVKALLLANIKTEISCGTDPTIPNKFREWYYDSNYALYRTQHYNDKLDVNVVDSKVMIINQIKKGEGIKCNVGAIDYLDKLMYNPCTDAKILYFGIKTNQSPYSLCRADDMDAFLWFVVNKAKFFSAYQMQGIEDLKLHLNATQITYIKDGQKKVKAQNDGEFSAYDYYYATNYDYTDDDHYALKNVACGTAIKYPNGNMISVCTKIKSEAEALTTYAQFFPCSDTYNGAMWYVDSFCYYGKDLLPIEQNEYTIDRHNELYGEEGIEKTDSDIANERENNEQSYSHPRDYALEFPIFKLEYDGLSNCKVSLPTQKGYDTRSYGSATSRNRSNLILKILPKPFIHYPCLNKDFQQWFLFKKILFDSKGNPTKNGHFSCYIYPSKQKTEVSYIRSAETDLDNVTTSQIYTNYAIVEEGGTKYLEYIVISGKEFNEINEKSNLNNIDNGIGILKIYKDGSYELKMDDGHLPQECLYPCYEPSTISQFNYQYVMGLQLFNAKQILTNALDFTLGLNGSMSVGLTEKQGMDRQRIIEIIKNMCVVDSSSISDCFYSFSNAKYERMMNDSDNKRHNGYAFIDNNNETTKVELHNISDILNKYDDCATLKERTDTLKRAITQASVAITQTMETADEVNIDMGISYEFIKELIQNLTISMVSALITPKVAMLFQVNKQILGDYSEYESVEDFLKANQALIIGLVQKIRDMILEELMAFVMDKLKILISLWSSAIVREYTEKISKIMKLLKTDCLGEWAKRRVLDTDIPIVQYADIDNTEVPITEHCE